MREEFRVIDKTSSPAETTRYETRDEMIADAQFIVEVAKRYGYQLVVKEKGTKTLVVELA